jgi:TetR/AcrR family transcriptional repressor of bet genes
MTMRTETEVLRRQQIMQATRDVISEKGLDRTTMRDIGQRAGMSAAIVCYYFEDKKRLLKETLIDASLAHRSTLDALIGSNRPPAEKLEAAVKDNLPMTSAQQREWRFWLDYWAEAARDPELRAFIADSEARFRANVGRIIAEGGRAGVFRSDVGPEELARGVVAMLEGAGIAHIMDPRRVDISAILASIHQFLAAR